MRILNEKLLAKINVVEGDEAALVKVLEA